jgi:ATP-dependent Clp protease ATP-binding subunit ClpC
MTALAGATAWSEFGDPKARGSVVQERPLSPDYSRFTDRARKVLRLAEEAAHRWRSGYLATEHILLGLLMEGQGVGAHVLMNLGVDIHGLRAQVETFVPTGPPIATTSDIPRTPRARNVVEFSKLEARSLNHNYVGTEHILLALLREKEGAAAQILMNAGLRHVDVRDEALNLLGHRLSQRHRAPGN